jgi:D-lactate dehydrogenase (cytochrome)
MNTNLSMDWPSALDAIRETVGPNGWLAEDAELEPYVTERRKILHGNCQMVVRPASTEETAKVVEICHRAAIPITPQGGNTGMVGGGVPDDGIVLSTERMTAVRELDAANGTITVDAGCILAEVQNAARDGGFMFPISLAAEGSCRIGGNIATNAGGNNTIRYGNTRDLVLGLEVVLPDGRVWNGLRALRKCNTGYDLKHLFIGSEGTLGVITAAVLALTPAPKDRVTAMVTANSWQDLLKFFAIMRGHLAGSLVAFETFTSLGMEITTRHMDGIVDPFTEPAPLYALIETVCYGDAAAVREALESGLGEAFEQELVGDAVIAESGPQADNLWRIRECLPEAQLVEDTVIKHDISVPISKIPAYVADGSRIAMDIVPGCRVLPFGHMGDGNLHFNLLRPENLDRDKFLARMGKVNRALHDLAVGMGGSFSAEHGIGQAKLDDLIRYRSDVEIEMMTWIKSAFDPNNLMNPGKVIIPVLGP